MKLFIPKDFLTGEATPPNFYLCNTSKRILGLIDATERKGEFKWNSYSTVSFKVSRYRTNALTGETEIDPLFDKIESPRNIFVGTPGANPSGYGYFTIQDVETVYGEEEYKQVTAFEYAYSSLGTKYISGIKINKGEVDSAEVIYLENLYGANYDVSGDNLYTKATGAYDPYANYYYKDYSDKDSYVYSQIAVDNAEDYAKYDGSTVIKTLYVKRFENVRLYWENKPELSLLHIILQNAPEWKIGHVDASLKRKERSFDISNRTAIYDFLTQQVADTFNCVVEFDSIKGEINLYEELDDGLTEDNEIDDLWRSDVIIGRDNLASECTVSYSSDNIKTKLVVSGGEDLDIREVNLDRTEIMNLSFYHTLDWMEQDLYDAYSDYLDMLKEAETGLNSNGLSSTIFPMSHSEAVRRWVAANNKYNDLVNAVPAENDTVLVGDEFKKLYCMYTPVNNAFVKDTIVASSPTSQFDDLYTDSACTVKVIKSTLSDNATFIVQGYRYLYKTSTQKFVYDGSAATTTSLNALVDKLNLYHVDDDINGTVNDNILLRLKNTASDVATIRIYDPKRVAPAQFNDNLTYYTLTVKPSGTKEYTKILQMTADKFATYSGTTLYTNNYTIQSIVARAESGLSDAPSYWSMSNENITSDTAPGSFNEWIRGNLTSDAMDLNGYTISYIGTMGAYFVLAENEFVESDNELIPSKEHLRKYGVNLLKEKHSVYTTIFQTQTEAMFSQEKYQCVASKTAPTGTIAEGTRWFDTDSNPPALYKYEGGKWAPVSINGTSSDWENYQRYFDNYQKLQAIQEVLLEREREANYCLDGHEVPDRRIDINKYTPGTDGVLRYNGQTLEADMHRAAVAHFNELTKVTGKKYTVVRAGLDTNLPVYTFTTSFDPIVYGPNTEAYNVYTQYYKKPTGSLAYIPIEVADETAFKTYDGSTQDKTLYVITSGNTFAVYLQGTTPYVSYANSRGICQMIRDYIRNKTEMTNFFTEDQYIRLSPFIREDEFTDSNFFLTEYDSEEQKVQIGKELMEAANKELNTLCQPSLEFSMTMANILALPEFEPLFDQFQLGKFIRVQMRDDYVKRARLLEVNINFEDLSDFQATFGNLVTTKSEVDKHAELLSQAVSAGKQVAVAASSWQRAVDKSNKLEEDIQNGLQNAAIQIGKSSNQAISWDSSGIHCRKYKEGSTTEYEPEEIAIINSSLVATSDSWKTSRSVFGKYTVAGEERWGLLADYITAQTLEGVNLVGGSLRIGDESGAMFMVNPDGTVDIRSASGQSKYASTEEVKELENARQYHIELTNDRSTIFSELDSACIVTCTVYSWGTDITQTLINKGATFSWIRISNEDDATWNAAHEDMTTNTITITNSDIPKNAQLTVSVQFDDIILNS